MIFPTIATIRGHTFLTKPLQPGALVLDFGANRGDFARQLTERFDVKCYSVEANPDLFSQIRKRDRVNLNNYAIAGTDAPVTFYLSENCEMSSVNQAVAKTNQRPVTVPGKTLASFLADHSIQSVDLLKLDIEGAERMMFDAASDDLLQRISQITIEFHDFLNAYPASEVDRMAGRLKSIGFVAVKFSRSNMNWLFYQPKRCGVGTVSGWMLKYPTRWARWARLALKLEQQD